LSAFVDKTKNKAQEFESRTMILKWLEDNQMFFGRVEGYPVCLTPFVYILTTALQSVLDFSQVFTPVKFLKDIQAISEN